MKRNYVVRKSEATGSYVVINKRTGFVVYVHSKARMARGAALTMNKQEWQGSEKGRAYIAELTARKLVAKFTPPPR